MENIKHSDRKNLINNRIQKSLTSVFKPVFPTSTNHYDTMFGGTALFLMDEVAFITATRFSRKPMVTVSSSKIDFKKPIPHGTIVELKGEVCYVGNTSLKVKVEIFIEQMYSDDRTKAIEGEFSFVALDKNNISVMALNVTS